MYWRIGTKMALNYLLGLGLWASRFLFFAFRFRRSARIIIKMMMSGAQTPPIKAANCLLVSESVNKIKVNNTSYQYKEQYLLSRLSIKVKAAIVGLLRLASYGDDSSRSSRYLSVPHKREMIAWQAQTTSAKEAIVVSVPFRRTGLMKFREIRNGEVLMWFKIRIWSWKLADGQPNSPLTAWDAFGLRSTVRWCFQNNFLPSIPSLSFLKFHSNSGATPHWTV